MRAPARSWLRCRNWMDRKRKRTWHRAREVLRGTLAQVLGRASHAAIGYTEHPHAPGQHGPAALPNRPDKQTSRTRAAPWRCVGSCAWTKRGPIGRSPWSLAIWRSWSIQAGLRESPPQNATRERFEEALEAYDLPSRLRRLQLGGRRSVLNCSWAALRLPPLRLALFSLSYGQLLNRILKMSFQRERPTAPQVRRLFKTIIPKSSDAAQRPQ